MIKTIQEGCNGLFYSPMDLLHPTRMAKTLILGASVWGF